MFWLLALALLVLTRLPVAAHYLSVDNVNLAFALQHFDPRMHQPQPPGYPFFVGFARFVNFFLRSAESTFLVSSIFVSALCLPLIGALGKRMFDRWVGQAAALLLLVNPVFWQSGLDGPLRPNLALFSILTAYCAWRTWNGDKTYIFWGACALGVGSGFRPDLLIYLTPVWLFSAWVGSRSIKAIGLGCVVLCAWVGLWVGILAYAVGGVSELMHLTTQYLAEQSSQNGSVVFGASIGAWFRQLNRLIIWNGLAIIGWIWAAPFVIFSGRRMSVLSPQSAFIVVWLAPGLMTQALIHVAAPGHTLFSIPALCLIGGYVLWIAGQRRQITDVAVAVALVINLMLFLNYVPLPPADSVSTGSLWQSAKNVALFGTFEASVGEVRYEDDSVRVSLKELAEFTKTADRPTIVVCEDVVPKQDWFMVWPIARYYLPERELWVVSPQDNGAARLIRGEHTAAIKTGSPVIVRVPKPVRILWLMERGGALHQALEKAVPLHGGTKVFYTDVNDNMDSFQVLNLLFRPGRGETGQQ
jgi:hypothetical protein